MKRLALWVLAVQLYATGPVYYWRVPNCDNMRVYTAALLAWADRAHLYGARATRPAPAVGCGWWDVPPPEMQDTPAGVDLVIVAPEKHR